MKLLPTLKGYVDGCIPESDILKVLSEDQVPLWENYMRGKTITQIGFDDWGIWETDYSSFKRHMDNLYLKELENEVTPHAKAYRIRLWSIKLINLMMI